MWIILVLHDWIRDRKFAGQVMFFFILSYLSSLLLFPIIHYANSNGGRDLSVLWGKDQQLFILFALIVSPIIETFIFQWLIYEQLNTFSFFKKRIYLIVLISGLTFGLIHDFSIEYRIFTFVIGCYFCFVFHYFKTYSKYPFLAVFIIHAARNLLVVLGQLYFKS